MFVSFTLRQLSLKLTSSRAYYEVVKENVSFYAMFNEHKLQF